MFGKGGLTGTVVTEDGHKFTALYFKRNIIHSGGNPFHIAFFVAPDIFKCEIVGFDYCHFFITCNYCIMEREDKPSFILTVQSN